MTTTYQTVRNTTVTARTFPDSPKPRKQVLRPCAKSPIPQIPKIYNFSAINSETDLLFVEGFMPRRYFEAVKALLATF